MIGKTLDNPIDIVKNYLSYTNTYCRAHAVRMRKNSSRRGCARSRAPPLDPPLPLMTLSATVTRATQLALERFLNTPVVEKYSVNRDNIYLAVEKCNFTRSGGTKQSMALDSRDFNSFADRVKEIVSDKCTIVYTDFACHVAPIVIALRDRNVQAIGYYGKMKEG